MKHTWRNIEIDVGTAMPGDPVKLNVPPTNNRSKYLRCPLCDEACGDSYWKRHHSTQLHLKCPLCELFFCKSHGLSMHFARSQCGAILLGAENMGPKQKTITITIHE